MSKKKENSKLQEAIAKIEKQFGKGLVRQFNSTESLELERISTGAMAVDQALGGGLPKGRIIEIFGPESSGKTTLALSCIAEVQKAGGKALFVDAEHAFDPLYAKKLGVNVDELLFAQPDYGEQGLDLLETLIESEEVGIVVVDSVASLVPKVELDGEAGQSHMGVHARLMSQAMRKLNGKVHKTNTIVIFLNQIRMKIGVMFGNPETVTGGNALKFYSSIRIDLRRKESIKKGDETLAHVIRAKIVKNKTFAPYREGKFEIYFDEGISRVSDIINMALENSVIQKKGAWYSYNDQQFQGLENLRQALKENDGLFQQIKKEVLEILEVQK